jgi:hypothetical protein
MASFRPFLQRSWRDQQRRRLIHVSYIVSMLPVQLVWLARYMA